MENKTEGKLGQRASVPAFGEWDAMKAAGVLPDYSLDFSKIRAVRMQRKEAPSWSSAGSAQEVAGGGEPRQSSSAADPDRDRRHRRQHSEADVRRPLRPDIAAPKTTPSRIMRWITAVDSEPRRHESELAGEMVANCNGRSKFMGCLFGCMGGW